MSPGVGPELRILLPDCWWWHLSEQAVQRVGRSPVLEMPGGGCVVWGEHSCFTGNKHGARLHPALRCKAFHCHIRKLLRFHWTWKTHIRRLCRCSGPPWDSCLCSVRASPIRTVNQCRLWVSQWSCLSISSYTYFVLASSLLALLARLAFCCLNLGDWERLDYMTSSFWTVTSVSAGHTNWLIFFMIYLFLLYVLWHFAWACQIPWNWRYRQLWVTVWVLGIEPGPLEKQWVLLMAEPPLQANLTTGGIVSLHLEWGTSRCRSFPLTH